MVPDQLVVSSDLIIRVHDGQFIIGTASSPRHVTVHEVRILEVLRTFSRPKSLDQALNEIKDGADIFVESVASLRRIGVLINATEPTNKADSTRGSRHQQACTHLASMAKATWTIAGDLMAFGPEIEQQFVDKTGKSVFDEIEHLVAHLDQLRSDLCSLRAPHQERLRARIAREFSGKTRNLHIGCGDHPINDWINVDYSPADFPLDIRWGLPIDNESVARIYLSHVLEHFYYATEVPIVLRELRRILKPSGTIRIVVPDIEKYMAAYSRHDDQFFRDRRRTWPGQTTRLHELLVYAGAGVRPDGFDQHKFAYDFDTLSHILATCGFRDVRQSEFMGSTDPELRIDDRSLVAGAQSRGIHYSLFVEATR